MPFRDYERKLAYQRQWYAAHRTETIAKIKHRQRTEYAGVCRNCGGPTVGQSKHDRPEWCAKPACASAQRRKR